MTATKDARGFLYSLVIIGTLVIIASLYSTVWANPSQGVNAGGTVPTVPTLPTLPNLPGVSALASCLVSPSNVNVVTSQSHQFSYVGNNLSGEPISGLTVTWSATTGGSISSGGLFTAGNTPGTVTVTGSGTQTGDQTCQDAASITVVVDAVATAQAAAVAAAYASAASAQAAATAAAPVTVPVPTGGAVGTFAPGSVSTLAAPDDMVTVTIPSEAPPGSFFLVYEPQTEVSAPAPSPAGFAFGTTLFELNVLDLTGVSASGTNFLQPITISVKYTDADLQAADGNPSRLGIHKYDSVFQVWTPLLTTFDTMTQTVHAQVSQLSFFALMGQAQPPTPKPHSTYTLLPPTPGDVAPGSGLLMGLLIAAFILIAAGSYYLRQSKQS